MLGDAGLLVDEPDPKLLAEAIDKILSDDSYRLELRRRAIDQSKQFDWSCIAAAWGELITRICEAKAETVSGR